MWQKTLCSVACRPVTLSVSTKRSRTEQQQDVQKTTLIPSSYTRHVLCYKQPKRSTRIGGASSGHWQPLACCCAHAVLAEKHDCLLPVMSEGLLLCRAQTGTGRKPFQCQSCPRTTQGPSAFAAPTAESSSALQLLQPWPSCAHRPPAPPLPASQSTSSVPRTLNALDFLLVLLTRYAAHAVMRHVTISRMERWSGTGVSVHGMSNA